MGALAYAVFRLDQRILKKISAEVKAEAEEQRIYPDERRDDL